MLQHYKIMGSIWYIYFISPKYIKKLYDTKAQRLFTEPQKKKKKEK